ncbi:hypothetical protein TELCIR_00671 [Teladorsagia circumcincta]|uniref:AMP-dependent synthetase/ligase domain-containing protein n=1 Tax=Teladorsagia circumcincta TaxID=45464 RepID=A0A2G9V450_TELCI|nr:hypothetical protein TELCIR_00671 [Teladorsagia circumcincta]
MSNSTAFVVSHLGVLKCGGIVTSASPSGSQGLTTVLRKTAKIEPEHRFPADLEHQLRDSKASVVFTEESFLPRVILAVYECSNVKKIICARSWASSAALPEGVVDFKKLIAGPVTEVESQNSSSDLAVLPYTDVLMRGTPTGVMLTHQNVSTAADIYQT